jgi:hypothetical protein
MKKGYILRTVGTATNIWVQFLVEHWRNARTPECELNSLYGAVLYTVCVNCTPQSLDHDRIGSSSIALPLVYRRLVRHYTPSGPRKPTRSLLLALSEVVRIPPGIL